MAFRISGVPQRWEPYQTVIEGEDGEDYYEDIPWEGEWVDDPDTGSVYVTMIGDDRKWLVREDDLTPLPETGYCSGCGQVGCSWGAH